eukprot:869038-Amphidinium_carterae.1
MAGDTSDQQWVLSSTREYATLTTEAACENKTSMLTTHYYHVSQDATKHLHVIQKRDCRARH